MRARFDIVVFDPRGFGLSTAVRCFPPGAERKFLSGLPLFPVGVKQDARRSRPRPVRRAVRRANGAACSIMTPAPTWPGTWTGCAGGRRPGLNYLGQSYGTGLGAIYANLFPGRVGRMVLDANLDPVAWTTPDGIQRPTRCAKA